MEEPDLAEETRPRKRGRTARVIEAGEAGEADQTNPPSQLQPTKKKKGRGEESNDKYGRQKNQGPDTSRNERAARPTRKGTKNAKEPQEPVAEEEADDENEDEGNSSLLRRSGRERKPMGEWYKSPNNKAGLQRVSAEAGKSPQEVSPTATRRKNQAKGDGIRRRRPAASAQVNSEAEAEAEAEADGEAEEESGPSSRTKRGKSKKQSSTTHGKEPTSAPRAKQRRMRSSLQQVQNADDQDDEGQQEAPRKSKRKGRERPQSEDNEAAEASSTQRTAKSRHGRRPRGQEDDSIAEEPSAASETHAQDVSKTDSNPKRKRKRPPTPPADASPEPEPEPERPPYRHIATHTRRVPRGVIESKWAPLDPSSISSVTDLLVTASRPVLLRLNNPARRAQAAAALGAVSNRLRSKLSRGLPFPPPQAGGTTTRADASKDGAKGGGRARPREDELEYERTVAGIRGLETALDPLLHSVELLRRERDRAQRELENEYHVLSTLKANARAQARERRGRGRKLHVLASASAGHEGSDGDDDDDDDSEEDAGGVIRSEESSTIVKPGSGNLFADILDLDRRQKAGEDGGSEGAELTALATQIADHMETMRGNLAQIDGITPALAGGRAALVDVLATHLGKERLEDVLLGS